MSLPKPGPGILDISPYVGGRAKAPGAVRTIKLSSNESPFGPSPSAIEAYKASIDKLGLYPEGSSQILRDAIAEVMGLNAERIICGTGSDEILHLLPVAYAGPGDEVIYSEHGFLVYKIATLAAGATPIVAPEKNLTTDVDAILARVTARTKLVFIANPNNPTGTYLPASEVRRLREGLPEHCLLVLDAAYCEYVKRNDFEAGLELVATTPNTIMTRTFSKIHGLAGLRVGWAYAPAAIIDVLNRIRAPFNVSIPAQYAAVAAIRDRSHVERSAAHNLEWIAWLREKISATGLKVQPSVANFLLIEFPAEGSHTAVKADAFLMKRGLILRHVAAYGLPNCLRLTIGTEEANRLVAAAIEEFMRTK